MGRGSAYPKVCTDHVLEYISLRNRMDSPSDCPLVTSPLLLLSSGIAHHRSALHLHSTSCGPSLPLPPPSISVICHLPTCSSCIPGLSTTLSSESPHLQVKESRSTCWQSMLPLSVTRVLYKVLYWTVISCTTCYTIPSSVFKLCQWYGCLVPSYSCIPYTVWHAALGPSGKSSDLFY